MRTKKLVARASARRCLALLLTLAVVLASPAYAIALKVHLEVHSLVRASLEQHQLGNSAAAQSNLLAAKKLMLAQPESFSALERNRVEQILQGVQTDGPPASPRQIVEYRRLLATLDPMQGVSPAKPIGPVLGLLQTAWNAVPIPVFVQPDVSYFSKEFRLGVHDADRAFGQEKQRRIPITFDPMAKPIWIRATKNTQTIDRWLATPENRRVYVTGARSDTEQVRLFRERNEVDGVTYFFYQDCVPLCNESTVGAFFGTAGSVINIESPEATNSAFTRVERRLMKATNGTGRQVVVIDGEDARRALNAMAEAVPDPIPATMLTCRVDQLRSVDRACAATLNSTIR